MSPAAAKKADLKLSSRGLSVAAVGGILRPQRGLPRRSRPRAVAVGRVLRSFKSRVRVPAASELRHKDGSMDKKTIGDRVQQENPEQVQVALRKQGRRQWAVMTLYERFEQVVALVLGAVIGLIIIVALVQLIRLVVVLLITESLNPLQHETFQLVFGMIMTLLIALEFKHSIIKVALRRDSIIQVKTVILIALIALSRKFVILDVETSPAKIAALAFALLTLGVVYWLMRERDECAARRAQQGKADEDE
jgi:uncharacterized membrane protein (DUF373 family)